MLTRAAGGVVVVDREPELAFAAEALVVVVRVVAAEGADEVLRVDRAAEPFEAVVEVSKHFNELDGCPAAYRTEGEAVDFVAFDAGDRESTVADRYVPEDAGVVSIVGAAVEGVFRIRNPFDLVVHRRLVGRRLAEDDDAAPEAAVALGEVARIVNVVQFTGEDDGRRSGPVSDDLGAAANDQGAGAVVRGRLQAFDNRAGFDGQRGAGFDEDKAVQQVGVIGRPGRVCADVIDYSDILRLHRSKREKQCRQ